METEKKANMITRSMREGTLLGLVVMLVVLYLLYTYGYLQPFETWKNRIEAGITIVLPLIGLGAIYGFFQGYRVKRRVDLVRETLVNWEKGKLYGRNAGHRRRRSGPAWRTAGEDQQTLGGSGVFLALVIYEQCPACRAGQGYGDCGREASGARAP